ncbi:MAG: O-antigen ligase family protein [Alphaproteobacteria bacterium]
MAAVLAGYALFGKGFAYLGHYPVFVGEVCLLVGCIQFLRSTGWRLIPRCTCSLAIVAFMTWGVVRTAPFLPVHGLDALRDAAVWGYGAFALLVAAALRGAGAVRPAVALYAAAAPVYLAIVPAIYLLFRVAEPALPVWPGTDVTIIFHKAGDIGVHVGAAAAALVVGLDRRVGCGERSSDRVLEWMAWLGFGATVVLLAAIKRAGFLAVVTALAIACSLRPGWRILRPVGLIALVAGFMAVSGLTVNFGERQRPVSIEMFGQSMKSLVGETDVAHLDGPANWRIEWWRTIIGYTILGDRFWTGKGYGMSLAVADGFLDAEFPTNRLPHNGHMTILARSGVPGLALWLLVNASFVYAVMRRLSTVRKAGEAAEVAVGAWLLAAWAAFIVNMTFDVYLEGPQGGIWFWSLIGFGIAWSAPPVARGGSDSDPATRGDRGRLC